MAQTVLIIQYLPPRPRWRGFSFALHLLRVQGFYFALLQYSPIQAFTVCFMLSMQFIPPTPQNSARGFTVAFPAICRVFTPVIWRCIRLCCTACKALEGIQTSAAPPAHTRYHRHAGRCTGQCSRPIIIRYIRVHPCYRSMPNGAA